MPHFASLADLIQHVELPYKTPFLTGAQDVDYEWIDWNDPDGGRICYSLSSKNFSPFLFRGQVQRFSPSYPSLYRSLNIINGFISENDLYVLLERRARMFEFISILKKHPAIEFSKRIGLHVDYIAISQHFGFETEYLDLSDDIDVAAFFATHQFLHGKYVPLFSGVGLIYKLHSFQFPAGILGSSRPNTKIHIEMIGKQVLHRPTRQSAWALVCPIGIDFEAVGVAKLTFERNKSEVLNLSNKFNYGAALFPDDQLYHMANRIRLSNTISRTSFMEAISNILGDTVEKDNTVDKANEFLQHAMNVVITDRDPIGFAKKEWRKILRDYTNEKCYDFLGNVGTRLVFKR